MRTGGNELAREHVATVRTEDGPKESGIESHGGSLLARGEPLAGTKGSRDQEPFPAQQERSRPPAAERRRPRVCAGDEAFALGRAAETEFRTANGNLFAAHRAIRSKAALRDYVDPRIGSCAGPQGRRGNGRRKIPRSVARDTVGRQGFAGYGRNSHHVWRGTVPRSPAEGRCRRGEAFERRGSGAHREAEFGRTGAERHLVRRANNEPVAARGRRIGFKRRTWRGNGSRTGGIRDRQRNRRKHRRAEHALWCNGTAADVWARASHGSDDAVLVARQARANGAKRGGYTAGARSDHRPGRRRCFERAEHAGL